MRHTLLVASLLLAAACGSKSSAPATTPEPQDDTLDQPAPDEPALPEGCDQSCLEGCGGAEDPALCEADCGCSAEAPCDQSCYGGCMSQDRPEEECVAECGCGD